MNSHRGRKLQLMRMILVSMVVAGAVCWLLVGGMSSLKVRAQTEHGCAAPRFGAVRHFSAGDGPFSVAVGDFNHDGKPDLAVANNTSDNISVRLNDGAGGFTGPINYGAGDAPVSVAAGDFNRDGKPDLAVANNTSNNVSILLGNGSGGFSAPSNFATGSGPVAVAVGDFNRDDKPDLVTANFLASSVSFLLGNGTGGFSAPINFDAGASVRSVAVSDFNLDGRLDLITANGNSNDVSILLGNGAGGFSALTRFVVNQLPLSVAVGDFNRDGKPDFVTANSSSDDVTVRLGDGAGGFPTVTNFSVGDDPRSVAVGDFNSDGKPDIVSANFTADSLSVLLGDGAGNFGDSTNFSVGDSPRGVAVGDFNSDGKLEFATANQNSDNVSVLLNTCAAFSCSGAPFTEPSRFIIGFDPVKVVVGDFNRDGKSDLASIIFNIDNYNDTIIMLGDGVGGFSAPTFFDLGASPISLAVGDFNRDGKPDLLLVNSNRTISVALGDGAGGFPGRTFFLLNGLPQSVAVGDFNRDGKPDLVVTEDSSGLAILLGDGAGGFSTPTYINVGYGGPTSVAVGDFNRDGKPDLVFVKSSSPNVSVLLGDGAGGFSAPTNFAAGDAPRKVELSDFNLDGKLDLVILNRVTVDQAVNGSVLLGDGAGGFSAPINFDVGRNPRDVAVGDFNGDGKPDLAIIADVTDFGRRYFFILLGDGSGGFSVPTSYNFEAGFDTHSVAIGDFNRDGKLDLAYQDDENTGTIFVRLNGCARLAIAPPTLPAGSTDTPYSQALTVSGGSGSFTFAVSSGSLPPGLALNSSTGQVSGTPTSSGDYPFTITATENASGDKVSRAYTLRIICAPPTTLDPATLPNGLEGAPYSQTLTAGGSGPFTFAVTSGTLPPGLTLNPAGTLSGTLQSFGIFSFTIRVANRFNCAATRDYTVNVQPRGCGVPFASPNYTTVGTDPLAVAVGDLNRDGKPDMAVANKGSKSLSILLGNGAGGFSPAPNIPLGDETDAVAVGDLNRDGKLDLAATKYEDNMVAVMLGDGAGGFSAPSLFGTNGGWPTAIAIVDLNGDLKPDVVTANRFGNNVSVLLGNGAGGLAAATNFGAGNLPRTLSVADFNNDGRPDLAVANYDSKNISILLGNGNGSFTAANSVNLGDYVYSAAVGDFNNDGKADLVGAVVTFNANYSRVLVVLGDGTGNFSQPTPYGAQSRAFSMVVSDFNNDNKLDIVAVANGTNLNASILLGTGTGKFSPTAEFAAGPLPYGSATADFNLDGRMDLVTTNAYIDFGSSQNVVGVLLNRCTRAQTLTLSPSTLPAGSAGTAYNQALTASGGPGPFAFGVATGALPPGLTLDTYSGQLSGTPTASGTYAFTIAVTDLSNGDTGSRAYNLAISCPTITVNPATLPNGAVGTAYNQSLSATGGVGSYTFAVTGGALPFGLSLSPSGVLSGTPSSGTDSFTFSVTATDTNGCSGSRSYTVSINSTCAAAPSNVISWWRGEGDASDLKGVNNGTLSGSATFATGKAGQAFKFDGTNGYVALPDNLFPYPTTGTGNAPFSFELWFKTSASGVILGQQNVTPYNSITGAVPAIYVGTDGKLRVEMFWNGSINQITSSGLVNNNLFHHVAVVYKGTTQTVYLDGGVMGSGARTQTAYAANYKYQLGTGHTGSRPSTNGGWFNFNGLIDEPTLYSRALTQQEVQAIFAGGGAAKCVPAITLSPTALPNGTVNTAYSQMLTASGGTAPYSFAVTSGLLPSGLTLNPNGSLSGTPTASGTFNFTVRATDNNGYIGSKSYTLTINCTSNFVVTNSNHTGAGSLRQTIADACPGATITFAPSVNGATIPLTGEVLISRDVTIIGPSGGVTLDSLDDATRVFQVAAGVTLNISNLTFIRGLEPGGVGGAILNRGTLNAAGCTFDNNRAPNGRGGALFNDVGATATLVNCTLANNSANNSESGGAIDNYGTLNLKHCTITGNAAPFSDGGGFANSGTATISHTIIAGNTAPIGPDIKGAIISQGYNLIGNTSGASGFIGSDLTNVANHGLDPAGLQNNGGPTRTIALMNGSPAINAGNPNFAPPPDTDQRGQGFPRVLGGRIDIGAFEAQQCSAITFAPSAVPMGTVGQAYPATVITPSGGTAPYTFTVTGLPSGLTSSATSTDVTLSGTPSQAGLFTVAVTATSANACAASITYRLVINQAGNTPGTVLITEVRTSGPAGPDDEFVELYNNSDAAIAIGGWTLAKMGANCAAAPVIVATIPAGTMLPARAHYLLTGSDYSLNSYASTNQTLTAGIEDDANLALFTTANAANFSPLTRMDAIGFGTSTGNYCDLLREGTTLPGAMGSLSEHSYVRKVKVASGAGTGRPLDTNDNAADLLLVSTTPATPVGDTPTPALGAPGPENLASPLQRNSQIRATLLEPALSPAEATNRRRYSCTDADRPANCDPNTAPLGYLSIRRTYTNLTGQPVTRLRFRVVDLTTTPESTSSNGIADVRALSRNSSFTVTSVLRSYTVQGLTLEPVPTQSRGGGFNSTLTVTLQTPLAAVDDPNTAAKENQVNVEFLLGIVQGGNFRLLVNVEAAP